MTIIAEINRHYSALAAVRRDLHSHPELGFEVERTAKVVADFLKQRGIEIHERIGGLGIVARIKKGTSAAAIGLRSDMDALPINEENTFDHKSLNPNHMHACGHDGHIAFLLGAADYLAHHGKFNGTVNLIFQPAEELWQRRYNDQRRTLPGFPCDSVFAVHNRPG